MATGPSGVDMPCVLLSDTTGLVNHLKPKGGNYQFKKGVVVWLYC